MHYQSMGQARVIALQKVIVRQDGMHYQSISGAQVIALHKFIVRQDRQQLAQRCATAEP